MGQIERAGHMDVSNSVDVTRVSAVEAVVTELMSGICSDFDAQTLHRMFSDFDALYRGGLPGYRACDIRYHNAQHVLDVTLAMARLLDGAHRAGAFPEQLRSDDLLIGIIAALFHDSGYIRSVHDTRQTSGAAYTRVHVSRGARLLLRYLPQAGLQPFAGACSRIIHFTGYEMNPDEVPVANEQERLLGHLLGTADLIAQMADINYISKCRDHLYAEFVAGGIAQAPDGGPTVDVTYDSPSHLLDLTPDFMRDAVERRLNGYFAGVHRYAAVHFGGQNLYMEAIEENRRILVSMLAAGGN